MPDKYDDLFDFYIKLYDDEIARFRELDGKIARYLSAYSILIALTGFVGLNLRFLLQGGEITPLVIVNYIGLAFVLLLLVPGWYYLLSALKLENLQRFAYDESVIQFFSDNEPVNIKYALSQRAKEAIVYNVNAGDNKANKIAKAFKWSFPAMGLLVASLLLAMFNVYEAKATDQSVSRTKMEFQRSTASNSEMGVVTMTEQSESNTTPSNQPQNQPQSTEKPVSPDPNVQAPQNVLITEGYEPPETPSSNTD